MVLDPDLVSDPVTEWAMAWLSATVSESLLVAASASVSAVASVSASAKGPPWVHHWYNLPRRE
jgi:hypothetical protein